jgi:hypothetical protein
MKDSQIYEHVKLPGLYHLSDDQGNGALSSLLGQLGQMLLNINFD